MSTAVAGTPPCPTLCAGRGIKRPVTCTRTAPDAEPRLDVPDTAASPDTALRRMASERAAAFCAASCGRPVPLSAAAAALTAPSAAWTLLFSDSLPLAGTPSALVATALQVGAG